MRTTIELPDELHHVIASLANSHAKSLSQTAVELMRRGLEVSQPGEASMHSQPATSAMTGLPRLHFPSLVKPDDVRSLDDEA
jgi:negative regulator of replication initiation